MPGFRLRKKGAKPGTLVKPSACSKLLIHMLFWSHSGGLQMEGGHILSSPLLRKSLRRKHKC